MLAWIRNIQTEAELWALKLRQGVLQGRLSGLLRSPRAKRQLLSQSAEGLSHRPECPRMEGGSEGRW